MYRLEDIIRLDPREVVERAWMNYRPRGWGLILQCTKTKPYTDSPIYRRIASRLSFTGFPVGSYDLFFASDVFCLVPAPAASMEPFNNYDVPPSSLSDPAHRRLVDTYCRLTLPRLTGRYIAVVVNDLREIIEKNLHDGLEIRFLPYRGRWTRADEIAGAFAHAFRRRFLR